jgi:hypothetical protein
MKNNMKMSMKMETRQKQLMSTRIYVVAGATTVIGLTMALTMFFNFSENREARAEGSGFEIVDALVADGDFRSIGSGQWNDAAIWEKYDGASWGPAMDYPTSTEGMITIMPGHEVVMSSDEIIDELNIGGALTLNSNRIMLLDGDINVSGTLRVNGRLMCGTNIISGTGSFALGAGSTMLIGSPKGITTNGRYGNVQTAMRAFSNNANYVYCGTEPQVTGNGLPADELNGTLTLDNDKGCSLTNSVTINNQLLLKDGILCLNGNTLTVNTDRVVSRAGGTLDLCGGNIAGDNFIKDGNSMSMDQFINSLAAENIEAKR